MENKKLAKALKEALRMEEKGYNFYRKAAEKAKNEITKRTFSFLADSEIMHIEDIKKFYDTLRGKGEYPTLNLEEAKDKRMNEMRIFSTSIDKLDEKIKPDDDDVKAYEFALDFENKGYKYYENMLKNATDKNFVKFLKFLLNEESRHYEIIENAHTYLTDSHNWFMYEEGAFPQGG